jgi:hypothetical protein
MAKPRSPGPQAEPKSVTAERAARLYRLVRLVGSGPSSRDTLMRRLRLDVRAFYRDLDLLRRHGIALPLAGGQYTLGDDLGTALARLPFPDPCLTLGEVQQLTRGRTAAHRTLQARLTRFLKPPGH